MDITTIVIIGLGILSSVLFILSMKQSEDLVTQKGLVAHLERGNELFINRLETKEAALKESENNSLRLEKENRALMAKERDLTQSVEDMRKNGIVEPDDIKKLRQSLQDAKAKWKAEAADRILDLENKVLWDVLRVSRGDK